jgi:hypothetical protein
VLDCPLFHHARIVIEDWGIRRLSGGSVGVAALLQPRNFRLQRKMPGECTSEAADMQHSTPTCRATGYSFLALDHDAEQGSKFVTWVPAEYEAPAASEGVLPSVGTASPLLSVTASMQVSSCGVHAICAPVSSPGTPVDPDEQVRQSLHAALIAIQQGMHRLIFAWKSVSAL